LRMRSSVPSYKVVVTGASSVGKSSIVQRLVQNTFSEDGSTTCGADFYTTEIPVQDGSVRLQIWDTAGQERFRSISRSYFRNAVGAILVYDITNVASFDSLLDWLGEFQRLAQPNSCVMLVGNKADLEEERQVGAQQVLDFAKSHDLERTMTETSALSGKHVQEAFQRLAQTIATRVHSKQIQVNAPVRAPPVKTETAGKGCC